MTEEATVRRAYRICPCSSWDVEGIQSWLEDMAQEGLILETDGVFMGIFSFIRTTPKGMIYRLEAVQKEPGFFDNPNFSPDAELLELSEELGWEYVLRYGMFHIYRSDASHPRELHTDPVVHAIAIDALRKRQRNSLIRAMIMVILWFVIPVYGHRYLFRNAATIGTIFVAAYLAFIAWTLIEPIRIVVQLKRYKKRLAKGEPLTRSADWRRHAATHTLFRLFPVLITTILLLSPLAVLITEAESTPLEEFDADPPFVTIQDLLPAGEYDRTGTSMGDYNTMRQWSTAVSQNMEWQEWASVRASDGRAYSGILRIDYHETVSPWIAEGLFNDYYNYELRRYGTERFSDLDAPVAGLDGCRAYSSYGIIHILMRQGNIVLHATVLLEDEHDNAVWEDWAILAAQQLAQGGA